MKKREQLIAKLVAEMPYGPLPNICWTCFRRIGPDEAYAMQGGLAYCLPCEYTLQAAVSRIALGLPPPAWG